jgi:clostripain
MNIARFREQTIKLCYMFILLCLSVSNLFPVQTAKAKGTTTELLSPGNIYIASDIELAPDPNHGWPPNEGDKLVGRFTLGNNGGQTIHLEGYGIRMRRNNDPNDYWDFLYPGAAIDLAPGQTVRFDQNNENPLATGHYRAEITWKVAGQWQVTSAREFDVVSGPKPGNIYIVSDIELAPDPNHAMPPNEGDKLVGRFTLGNNGGQSVHLEGYGIRMRQNNDPNDYWDFLYPGAAIDLAPGQTVRFDQNNENPLATGHYRAEITWKVAGQWQVTSAREFDVGKTPTNSISGRVVDETGNAIPGVNISANNGNTTSTDANGNYTLSGLTQGNYTITPAKSGFRFTPSSLLVTLAGIDVTGINFTGSGFDGSRPWTLMYYIAADSDADLESVLTIEYFLLKEASSNPNVTIVAFWDGMVSDARYDVFSPSGITRVMKGELNTGDPTTLKQFVEWAQGTYPADHYALVISDHGSGVSGVAYDYHLPNPGKDSLTPSEIKQALTNISKLDIVYMDACLMGTIESMYQLRGLAEYYVGSEAVTWGSIRPDWYTLGYHEDGNGWQINISPIGNSTTSKQLAIAMAQSYAGIAKHKYERPSTISVVNLDSVDDVKTATSTLASLLKDHMTELHDKIRTIKSSYTLQHFDSNGDNDITDADEYVDLYQFAELVQSNISQTEIKNAANQLMTSLHNFIVDNEEWSGSFTKDGKSHTWLHGNSHGVSIFFPNYSRSFYKDGWLDFTAGTEWNINKNLAMSSTATIEWGPMIVEYVRQTNPNIPDNPNPPPLLAPQSLPSVDSVSVSTTVNPTNVDPGGTALVTVSLDNVPAEGYSSAEFSCTYDNRGVARGSILVGSLFGADPVMVVSPRPSIPEISSFIVAIAGSNGAKATTSGAVFTFGLTAQQVGVGPIRIDCTARASKGDGNVITLLSSGPATLTIGGEIITPTASQPPTPSGSPTPIVTGTLTASPTALPPNTLNGQVLAGKKQITVKLFDAANTLIASASTNPDGTFSLTAPAGRYSVLATASGFLSAQGLFTITDGNATSLPAIHLLAGDIDNNNIIDPLDALTIGMNYGAATPAAADLNDDGVINFLDIELLAAHYRRPGPITWQ